MKKFMKKIEKKDISFLVGLGLFVIVAIFRFFDEKINFRETPWAILQDYNINKLAIVVLIGSMFLFFFVCILKLEKKNKKMMYYLCAFLAIFVCPMFVTVEYFGALDMYAWIFMFIIGVCFVSGNAVGLSIPLSFFMIFISPMSLLNCGCLVIVLSIYKVISNKQKRYTILLILNVLAEVTAWMISASRYGLYTDVQNVISFTKFIVMVVMFIPYLLIATDFFVGLIKKSKRKNVFVWICFMISAIPSLVVYIYLGDYTRAVFYAFMYFIMMVMCFIALQDEIVINQMIETKTKIREWVPIPAIVIAYPLLFITLWIAGPTVLFTEVFTG